MPAFLDTSIILSRLFNQAPQLSDEEWNAIENPYASELVRVEARRVIERQKLDSGWSDQIFAESLLALETMLSGINLVTLGSPIITRACQPFGVRVKTLDALHLSTALLISRQEEGMSWIFYTHDDQLKNAARTFGFQVRG